MLIRFCSEAYFPGLSFFNVPEISESDITAPNKFPPAWAHVPSTFMSWKPTCQKIEVTYHSVLLGEVCDQHKYFPSFTHHPAVRWNWSSRKLFHDMNVLGVSMLSILLSMFGPMSSADDRSEEALHLWPCSHVWSINFPPPVVQGSMGCGLKRFPTKWPLAPSVTSLRLSANDKDHNEMIAGLCTELLEFLVELKKPPEILN